MRLKIEAKEALQAFVRQHGPTEALFEAARDFAISLAHDPYSGSRLPSGDFEEVIGKFQDGRLVVARWSVTPGGVRVQAFLLRTTPRSSRVADLSDEVETDNDGNPLFGPEDHGLLPDDSPTPPAAAFD